MKFTSDQAAFIRYTRARIKNLENQQTELYNDLLDEVKVNEQAEEWLFDYVYNNFGSIKKIESLNK